jgi:hypothetical protein
VKYNRSSITKQNLSLNSCALNKGVRIFFFSDSKAGALNSKYFIYLCYIKRQSAIVIEKITLKILFRSK